MILHNQQAVPHEKYLDLFIVFRIVFSTDCHAFSCFFEARFRYRFLIAFLMEKGTKMTSKIDPRGDLFGQIAPKKIDPFRPEAVPEPTFFRASIFGCILVAFRHHFGQYWALLAPFWPLLAPCWALLAPFWEHFGRSWLNFARNIYNLKSIFAGGFSTKNLVAKRKNN